MTESQLQTWRGAADFPFHVILMVILLSRIQRWKKLIRCQLTFLHFVKGIIQFFLYAPRILDCSDRCVCACVWGRTLFYSERRRRVSWAPLLFSCIITLHTLFHSYNIHTWELTRTTTTTTTIIIIIISIIIIIIENCCCRLTGKIQQISSWKQCSHQHKKKKKVSSYSLYKTQNKTEKCCIVC